MTKTEVATMLKEALEPFCETLKDLRPALAHPFRQEDCVMASDGRILIAIKAKEAGVSIGKFKEMTDFNAHKAIPQVGSDDLLQARTIERSDLLATIGEMKRLEKERQQVIAADVLGVWLSIEALSRIEVAMRICGADAAQLVWHKDGMVVVQLYNAKGEACVTILSMGFLPKDAHVIALPTHDDDDHCSVTIDWQKGAAAWADIKAELARQEESVPTSPSMPRMPTRHADSAKASGSTPRMTATTSGCWATLCRRWRTWTIWTTATSTSSPATASWSATKSTNSTRLARSGQRNIRMTER